MDAMSTMAAALHFACLLEADRTVDDLVGNERQALRALGVGCRLALCNGCVFGDLVARVQLVWRHEQAPSIRKMHDTTVSGRGGLREKQGSRPNKNFSPLL
jgi:hypothetical protein